jgi:two-component system response regulator YesN
MVIADNGFIDREFVKKVASSVDSAVLLTECDGGWAMIDVCSSRKPRLVMLDCGIADIDAHEAARKIWQHDSGIVVVMTGWDEKYLRKHEADLMFSPNVAEYLLKPIHHRKMRETLTRYLKMSPAGGAGDSRKEEYAKPAYRGGGRSPEIAAALTQIDDNFRECVSLKSVASSISMTSSYFSKLFKQEVGENFIHYLTKRRLEYAKRMIAETGRSMLDVAIEAGFREQNYFGKVFKKYMGLTPLEYKRNVREDRRSVEQERGIDENRVIF